MSEPVRLRGARSRRADDYLIPSGGAPRRALPGAALATTRAVERMEYAGRSSGWAPVTDTRSSCKRRVKECIHTLS